MYQRQLKARIERYHYGINNIGSENHWIKAHLVLLFYYINLQARIAKFNKYFL